MLYSASRRTDMPAFFPDEIVGRVKRSRRLDGIVFWTKDVRNFVRHPDLARVVAHIPSVVQFTVTGLAGSVWEPNVAPLETQLPELAGLAAAIPPKAIRWRFDPILPDETAIERFRKMKALLASALGDVETVTVSFPDPYRHAVARAAGAGLEWPTASSATKRRILADMVAAFRDDGVDCESNPPVRLCCEPDLLTLPGVGMARCVDGALFETLYGLPLADLEKDAGQRAACGCAKSTDIGSYAMRCPHQCRYCYANPEERK